MLLPFMRHCEDQSADITETKSTSKWNQYKLIYNMLFGSLKSTGLYSMDDKELSNRNCVNSFMTVITEPF